MGRSSIIFIFLIIPVLSIGQYDGEGRDEISRFHPGAIWFMTGFGPAQSEKVRKYDRLIFDITYNDWSGDRDPFNLKWNSIGFNTNWMFDIPLAKKNVVSLGVGPSYSLQRFVHNEVLAHDSAFTYTQFSDMWELPDEWQESFNVHEFALPLELRFRTNGWRHFKVHVGGKIGYRTNVIRRAKYSDGDIEYDIRYRSLPDVNHLSYSAHVRIGMRSWAIYGSYNFSPLFKSGESIQLYPLQMGLSISLF